MLPFVKNSPMQECLIIVDSMAKNCETTINNLTKNFPDLDKKIVVSITKALLSVKLGMADKHVCFWKIPLTDVTEGRLIGQSGGNVDISGTSFNGKTLELLNLFKFDQIEGIPPVIIRQDAKRKFYLAFNLS